MSVREEVIEVRVLPTGRSLHAIRQIAVMEAARADPELARRCRVADEALSGARAKEAAWRRVRAGDPETQAARERLGRLDDLLDRRITALLDGARGLARAHGPGTPGALEAEAFAAHFFPEGAAAITQLPCADQRLVCDEMAAALREEPWSSRVAALGLGTHVGLVTALLPEYGALVDRAAPTELTYAEVQAARAAGRHALLGVVAWLAALDDQALAATLYAPIRAQQEALASRARRRAPTDVDPDTGAELPEPPPA